MAGFTRMSLRDCEFKRARTNRDSGEGREGESEQYEKWEEGRWEEGPSQLAINIVSRASSRDWTLKGMESMRCRTRHHIGNEQPRFRSLKHDLPPYRKCCRGFLLYFLLRHVLRARRPMRFFLPVLPSTPSSSSSGSESPPGRL